MLTTFYPAGSTSVTVYVRAFTASTGEPNPSLVFNQSGLVARYIRNQSASTTFTLVTQTAGGAWTSGGFVHVSDGLYRVDIPNAAFNSGVDVVMVVLGGVTDCVFTVAQIDLRNRNANVTQWSGTNVPTPNTAGYPIVTIKSGTATGELNITTGTVAASVAGTVAANVTQWSGTNVPTPNTAGYPIVTHKVGTGTGELSITSGTVAASVAGTVTSNVTQWNGSAVATPDTAGFPKVTIKTGAAAGELSITSGTVAASVAGTVASNVTQWGGSAIATPDTAGFPKVTIKNGTGAGELSIASGVVQSDLDKINGVTVTGNGTSQKFGV